MKRYAVIAAWFGLCLFLVIAGCSQNLMQTCPYGVLQTEAATIHLSQGFPVHMTSTTTQCLAKPGGAT